MSHRWAKLRGIQPVAMEALWDAEGDPAGTKRNQRMYDFTKPDLVVAFSGGTGTANMMKIATPKTEVIDVELIKMNDPAPIVGYNIHKLW